MRTGFLFCFVFFYPLIGVFRLFTFIIAIDRLDLNLSSFCLFVSSEFYLKKRFLLYSFPCGSAHKESTCNSGDLGLIPELGRSPGEGKGYPLQYSGLENSSDCIVHGVAKSRTRLSDFHFHSQ